jgi:hypothetical protein
MFDAINIVTNLYVIWYVLVQKGCNPQQSKTYVNLAVLVSPTVSAISAIISLPPKQLGREAA